MCEHCSSFATERFFSDQDFTAFEKAFEKKSLDGTFIRVINSNQISQNSQETTFECTHCHTDWVLSVPDGDWQGFFLPNDRLTEYNEYEYDSSNNNGNNVFKANFNGNKGNCGCCLVLFLLFVGSIFYGIYSVFDFILDLLF